MKYTITKKGYKRGWIPEQKRLRMEHDVVWENKNGQIPTGMCIHHINGNKTDNRIINLQVVTHLYHKRIHSGCIKIGNQWFKPCGDCCEIKNEKEYYKTKQGWLHSECKKCSVKRITKRRIIRKHDVIK